MYTGIPLALAYLDHAVLQYSAVMERPGSNRRDQELRVVSVRPQGYGGEEGAHVAGGEADVYGPRDAGSTVKVSPPALFSISESWCAGRDVRGRGWGMEGVVGCVERGMMCGVWYVGWGSKQHRDYIVSVGPAATLVVQSGNRSEKVPWFLEGCIDRDFDPGFYNKYRYVL